MQLNNKFVKPKTRVPIQQPTPKIVQAVARTEAISNRPSLRSFLNNPVGSKRMKTSIWGTPKAKIYDSNSYIWALRNKKNSIEKKRKLKEMIKQINEDYKRQKFSQRQDCFDSHDLVRDFFPTQEWMISQSYTKPNLAYSERLSFSKGTSEAAPYSRFVREDPSRAFEEAEMKSTAVSWREGQIQKDTKLKSPRHNPYYDDQIDHDNSHHEIYPEADRSDKDILQNERCLLDEIFYQANKEELINFDPNISE